MSRYPLLPEPLKTTTSGEAEAGARVGPPCRVAGVFKTGAAVVQRGAGVVSNKWAPTAELRRVTTLGVTLSRLILTPDDFGFVVVVVLVVLVVVGSLRLEGGIRTLGGAGVLGLGGEAGLNLEPRTPVVPLVVPPFLPGLGRVMLVFL